MSVLDLSYSEARPVAMRAWRELDLWLVGCGGNGGWLLQDLARLVRLLRERGMAVSLKLVDPDIVEPANVLRQNFCDAEVGLPKATTLALRFNTAWGLDIEAICQRFDPEVVRLYREYGEQVLSVVIGAVDNAAARSSIAAAVARDTARTPMIWWLDLGNHESSGQVLCGSAATATALQPAFCYSGIVSPQVCAILPSPALQHPELLVPLPEELTDNALSCEEMARRNAQALTINRKVAAEAADYLLRLLVTRDLRRFATYIDLPSGVVRSRYTTPEQVAAVIGKQACFFDPQPPPASPSRPS
jgi:PRTRC genetic system ThiF family protein